MLSVKLICVGKLRERFYTEAFAEYRKRLQGLCRFELAEIAEQRLPDSPSEKEITAALEKEAQEILRAVPDGAYLTALCVEGRPLPSEGLAALIRERENAGRPRLCFVVGGSFGLAPTVKERAQLRLSMSEMTFPHHLARIMLIEQIYRALMINAGTRYHK